MMKKISRRDVMIASAGAAGHAFITGAIQPVGESATGFVRKSFEGVLDRFDYDIDPITSVFERIDVMSSFVPGQSHPGYEWFHPDDEYVADVLDELIRDAVNNRLVYDEQRIPQNLKGTTLATGSPVSNALSRWVLQYSYVDSQEPFAGLLREKDPVFEMDYEFLLARNALDELGINEPIGRRGRTGNWSLVNRRTGEVMVAETRNGRLISDYLMVTRLPNVGNQEGYNAGEGLFILAGTHGVGTKAVDLLLRDGDLLSKLNRRIGRSKYWQAVFKVEGVDHYHETKKFGTRWHPVRLAGDFEFSPVSFDETRIQEIALWER